MHVITCGQHQCAVEDVVLASSSLQRKSLAVLFLSCSISVSFRFLSLSCYLCSCSILSMLRHLYSSSSLLRQWRLLSSPSVSSVAFHSHPTYEHLPYEPIALNNIADFKGAIRRSRYEAFQTEEDGGVEEEVVGCQPKRKVHTLELFGTSTLPFFPL